MKEVIFNKEHPKGLVREVETEPEMIEIPKTEEQKRIEALEKAVLGL